MRDDDPAMIVQNHLREMIEFISGELELRPLLNSIVQKACELLNADRGSIGLVDLESDRVKIEAIYKMPPEELGSVAKSGEGLAGKVLLERQPVLIERYGDLSSPQLGDTPPLPLTMRVLTSGAKIRRAQRAPATCA